jgi:hypothetical protein
VLKEAHNKKPVLYAVPIACIVAWVTKEAIVQQLLSVLPPEAKSFPKITQRTVHFHLICGIDRATIQLGE